LKKRKRLVWEFYGFFLSRSTPSKAMAIIMAAVAAAKYISNGVEEFVSVWQCELTIRKLKNG
jgi:hypothetical protein